MTTYELRTFKAIIHIRADCVSDAEDLADEIETMDGLPSHIHIVRESIRPAKCKRCD